MAERPALEQILGDAYLEGLRERSMDEIRQVRADCEAFETELSFERRLLQGRVDIIKDELARRAEGRTSSPAELITRLPSILADTPSGTQRGNRLVRILAPGDVQRIERDLDDRLGMSLGDVAGADIEVLERALERLAEHEGEVSSQRRLLHQRLDAVQAEMARRYRDGEADVDSLLAQD